MVYIPQGTFMMGSDGTGFNQDEAPKHKVTISKGFRMSATEITNLQYEQFRPSHKELRGKGGFSSGDDERQGNDTDSRPKRNGNMPAGQEPSLNTIPGTLFRHQP